MQCSKAGALINEPVPERALLHPSPVMTSLFQRARDHFDIESDGSQLSVKRDCAIRAT